MHKNHFFEKNIFLKAGIFKNMKKTIYNAVIIQYIKKTIELYFSILKLTIENICLKIEEEVVDLSNCIHKNIKQTKLIM